MKTFIKYFILIVPATLLLINCTNYGTLKEFNGVQVYYTKNITESEATSFGLYLSSTGFADGQNKTVQLNKTANTYEVRMVVKKGIELDPEYCEDAKRFGANLSHVVFNDNQVDVHFCDRDLNTLRSCQWLNKSAQVIWTGLITATIMKDLSHAGNQIHCVTNFQDLVSTPFRGEMNAMCWNRKLQGDFSEIVKKIELNGNIAAIEPDKLRELQLSEQGQLAREILLSDLKVLKAYGASPILNVIKYYDRDDTDSFFPTDVYSFHVDRSPIPIDTFLCTYYGEPSEILPNSQGIKKVLIPEIRYKLKADYRGADEGFESFLSEHFFDLHYQAKPNARPISLGLGNLWKLAVDHPESQVPPCLHRAPKEKSGQNRLLLIC